MTIILAIWAAAAVAGTVTAVVLTRKRKRQVAICDTCEYLQIRNDHNDPKDGTTWFCSYGRGHRFTDPPEYCKMYQPRSMCTYQERQELPRFILVKQLEVAKDNAVQVQECTITSENNGYVWEV